MDRPGSRRFVGAFHPGEGRSEDPVFLKDIEAHRPDGRNRYAEGIRAAEAAGAPVAGIWRLFAWKPALAEPLSRFVQEVLRGPSPFPPGYRELIAAFTSARNHCLF